GQFDLNFRDERFLPFEGAGVVSRWRIELPHETNRFDVGTITDVILQLSYMAREGGAALGAAAKEAAFDAMAAAVENVVVDAGNAVARRLILTSQVFAAEWGTMGDELDMSSGNEGDQVLTLSLEDVVPFLPGQDEVEVAGVQLAARWADQGRDLDVKVVVPSKSATSEAIDVTVFADGTPKDLPLGATLEALSSWEIRIKRATIAALGTAVTEPWPTNPAYRRIRADALLELFLVVDFVRARTV
ncbi:MAG: hypothetical protein KC731_25295, partial [Myxococcales bacterium]|nr:hypothetical protein [Myxococcales bacterium]